MSTIKISQLPSITGANADGADLLPLVDTSLNVTNKITRSEFFTNIPSLNVAGNVTVDTNTFFVDSSNNRVGVGTTSPAIVFHTVGVDSGTNTVLDVFRIDRQSSGTPAAGIGVGMEFAVETAVGNTEVGAVIEAVTTDVTATSEDFDLVFRTMAAGAAAAERMRVTSTGALSVGDAATTRTNLGLAIGTNVQAYDAALQSIAGLTTAADRMIYTTAADTYAVTTLTSFGRSLIDDVDAAAARTTLGVVIGTNVQAYDAALQSIAGLTYSANQMIYTTGADTFATTSITAAGRAILDDADAAAQRTTLGLGTLATQSGTFSDAVLGPASATDNAITRFDATTGKLVQNSVNLIGDLGQIGLNGANYGIEGDVIISGGSGAAPSWGRAEYSQILDANRTLTSTTAAQAIFPTASDTLTLPVGTYEYECLLFVSNMSATSGNLSFELLGAGTAIIASASNNAVGLDASLANAGAASYAGWAGVSSTAPIVVAATATSLGVTIRGMFKVSTAGTIVPSIALTTAAAATMNANSRFYVKRVYALDTTATFGPWA